MPQPSSGLLVTLRVALQFRLPVIPPGFRRSALRAVPVQVPEAPMNEDDLSPRHENHVRTAGKAFDQRLWNILQMSYCPIVSTKSAGSSSMSPEIVTVFTCVIR